MNLNRLFALIISGALPFVAADTALAQDAEAPDGDADSEGEDEGLGLSGTVIFDNAVGVGTFYRDDARSFVPTLTLLGAWKLPGTEHVSLGGRFDLTLYSLSDGGFADDRDPGEKVRPADAMLTLGHSELLNDEDFTGLVLNGSLRFYIPTSPGSRHQTLILGLGPRLGLKRKFGFLTLSAGSRIRYNAFRSQVPITVLEDEGGDVIQACASRGGGAGEAGDVEQACGGFLNMQWRWYHDFAATFRITPKLTASISLFIINSFKFETEVDELSSEAARQTAAENQSDLSWGVLDVSYAVTDHFALAVGSSSLQPYRTTDTKRTRFPWWSFEGPQDNYTSLYADVAGSF